jgi:tetratricopeptide (TPR) repeat protein
VARSSGARKPGETVTGSVPSTSAQQLAQAAQLASDGKVLEALKVYDGVLKENPRDVRAITYKGWLLRNVGVESNQPELARQGVTYLEQATEIDPRFAEAWLFRGIVYLRDDDDPAKATEALKAALASDPIPEVSRAARELLAEINQTPSTTTTAP